jgi:uncharacterized protein YkwD/uncharacterized protein YhfF
MTVLRFCQQTTKSWFGFILLCLLALNSVSIPNARAQGGYDPTVQTPTLLYDEARTVYLGNLARRDNGIPPLRWNRQLTYAARWFSWDSTENRPAGFCGHQDTQGHWPDYRAAVFGYLGSAGAENSFCGYVTPEDAIQGWMNSPGHRANLLDPNSREIGLGYYLRNSDGRGYVTQDFGNDAIYAPIIIENEAISTISPNVNLYIYNRLTGGGFATLDAATHMMVSNNAQFSGATWEPYSANKAWTLVDGNGWREVYVKTRDKFNRSLTASDTIYLGANVPLNELGAAQMSTTQSQVTLYNLNGGALPQAQFSLGWLADDTFGTFNKLWGNGERINDAAAWGGTTYRLYPGNGESSAWVYDTTFIKDTPLVAYFRLKVNNNTSSSEVARVSVRGGGTEYGPLTLRGTDFTAPNQYQEFALNFTFNSNPNDAFLIFQFWRSGSADVYVDAVSIFSAPQAITSPLTWSVPGNNYRGQGVWVRYTNGSQFSPLSDGVTNQPFRFTVNKIGTGMGTVTSNPAGINCGSTCSYEFNSNTDVTLTASAAAGSTFTGWSGDCSGTSTCTVSMTTTRSATASFITSNWYIYGVGSFVYGTGGDIPVVADYNGDGKDDIAIFRPSTSTWHIRGVGSFVFGTVGDIPVIADYNGDGKADIAIFRPSTSTWYIYGVGSFVFGTAGDIPVIADYNGDGKADIAVFRPSTSTWYIYGVGSFVYGTVGDIPVIADYNGDGKADIAVFRPSTSTWYIYGVGSFVYGTVGDIPVIADYDGNGKADIAVFRPSNSTWYIYGVGSFVYGTVGDIPVIADYNGDSKADIAVFRP